MKKINIRYLFQSINSSELKTEIFTLSDVEMGAVQKMFQDKGFKIVGRDLGSGVPDTNGVEIFDNDYVVSEDRNDGKPIDIIFLDGKFMGKYGKLCFDIYSKAERIKVIGNKVDVPNWIDIKKAEETEIEDNGKFKDYADETEIIPEEKEIEEIK